MKLQTRARLGVAALFAALLVLIAGLSGRALMRGLLAAEQQEANDLAWRARRVVDAQLETVRRMAHDYAEWNDTWDYVQNRTPAYERDNWIPPVFLNAQVDGMLVFDRAGSLVGGAFLAADRRNMLAPTAAQCSVLAPLARLAATSGTDRPAGLCDLAGRPAFVACWPALPAGGVGEPRGSLVTVRFVDERLVARLVEILGVKNSLLSRAELQAVAPEGMRLLRVSDERIVVEVAVPGVDGRPLVGLGLEMERVVHAEGVRARRLLFWQLLGAGVLVAAVTGWLLRWQVIRRLEILHAELARLGDVPGARGRVQVLGNDEIAAVARGVNAMVARLERDDQERNRARHEREQLQEQLVHAQKMEAVGEFAGGVAHDFNNCLTSIVCWLQLAKEELPPNHAVQENLELALNSVNHAASVVQQLLTYSRSGTAPLAGLRLGELLSESILLLRSGLPRSIELRLHDSVIDDWVKVDRTQLLQVLMNLLNNARDAMGKQGTLTIGLGELRLPSPAAPRQTLHLPAGDYVRLSVSDTGPGIPPENLERIFKPFFTTKPAGKGTGLGLAVVQSVVARHNGTVWAESTPGTGTVFHVLLPRCQRDPVPVVPASAPAAPLVRGLRVLLVEDDPAVARALATSLERRGCAVLLAADGTEGWALFNRAETVPEVVLTDYTMPGMNGLQLAGKILESGRRVPVVLMTAFSAVISKEQTRQCGLAAVLAKPLLHDEVAAVLAQAVGLRSETDPVLPG